MDRSALRFVILLLILAPRTQPAGDDQAALTNEDVVRMVANGTAEEEILHAIGSSRAQFDLEPDILLELRRAGVPERVLRAMRERQAVFGAVPAPTLSPVALPKGRVELEFAALEGRGKRNAPRTFTMIRKTPRWAARHRAMPVTAEVEDLGLFLACTTPEHVPDFWQDRTPLKDSVRHELLTFRPGSRPGKKRGFEVLSLEIPPSLEVEVPAGSHSLLVGVAFKVGADWHAAVSDLRKEVRVAEARVTRLEVKVSGRLIGSTATDLGDERDFVIGKVSPPEESP